MRFSPFLILAGVAIRCTAEQEQEHKYEHEIRRDPVTGKLLPFWGSGPELIPCNNHGTPGRDPDCVWGQWDESEYDAPNRGWSDDTECNWSYEDEEVEDIHEDLFADLGLELDETQSTLWNNYPVRDAEASDPDPVGEFFNAPNRVWNHDLGDENKFSDSFDEYGWLQEKLLLFPAPTDEDKAEVIYRVRPHQAFGNYIVPPPSGSNTARPGTGECMRIMAPGDAIVCEPQPQGRFKVKRQFTHCEHLQMKGYTIGCGGPPIDDRNPIRDAYMLELEYDISKRAKPDVPVVDPPLPKWAELTDQEKRERVTGNWHLIPTTMSELQKKRIGYMSSDDQPIMMRPDGYHCMEAVRKARESGTQQGYVQCFASASQPTGFVQHDAVGSTASNDMAEAYKALTYGAIYTLPINDSVYHHMLLDSIMRVAQEYNAVGYPYGSARGLE